jgi:hypothetical protein
MRLTCVDVSTSPGALVAWQARPDAQHHFVFARDTAELLAALRATTARFDVLDLFCHGFGGGLTFGGCTLFSSDGWGFEHLGDFSRCVAPGGKLRLLGCETALDSWWKGGQVRLCGRALLDAIAARLDGGTAWGTTARLSFLDFGRTGLDEAARASRLVSSGSGAAQPEGEVAVAGGVVVGLDEVVQLAR